MVFSHSVWVNTASRTKVCKWRIARVSTSRRRAFGAWAMEATTASVNSGKTSGLVPEVEDGDTETLLGVGTPAVVGGFEELTQACSLDRAGIPVGGRGR